MIWFKRARSSSIYSTYAYLLNECGYDRLAILFHWDITTLYLIIFLLYILSFAILTLYYLPAFIISLLLGIEVILHDTTTRLLLY
jgi:hypothetical protein